MLSRRKNQPNLTACRDCAHVLVSEKGEALCDHPRSPQLLTNYYTGETKPQRRPIGIMRTFGDCKPEATLFEPTNRHPRAP